MRQAAVKQREGMPVGLLLSSAIVHILAFGGAVHALLQSGVPCHLAGLYLRWLLACSRTPLHQAARKFEFGRKALYCLRAYQTRRTSVIFKWGLHASNGLFMTACRNFAILPQRSTCKDLQSARHTPKEARLKLFVTGDRCDSGYI